ncbi:helix-turn-helix transcriptional regulator [Streptomyces sp. NPDC060209]|uniref:helix-turn-helix transcriptional regulator n=1 Tax=Streptomyces sp. NPDC060209 TaxID=3347073 RepID=UPI00365EB5D2
MDPDRAELADFLRRCRARLAPAAVGLVAGPRRRTPGLRREEAARLTGASVDHYTRLEQGRGARPSRQMLAALARALRLTDDERDHLFRLAGEEPPRTGDGPTQHVRPGLLMVLDRLHDAPALVYSDRGELLAQNALATALGGEFEPGHNVIRGWFTDPTARRFLPPEDHAAQSLSHVAQLRAVSASRPDDPHLVALVKELRSVSEEFDKLWAEHRVAMRRAEFKRFLHPVVGPLELGCEVLLTADCGQRLVIHTAEPGSESYERLRLLRVIGVQELGAPAPPDAPPAGRPEHAGKVP